MPSFTALSGSEGFLFSGSALVSQSKTIPRKTFRGITSKDQCMKKLRFVLALASLSVLSAARPATVTENFSANPLQNGWRIFGATNLFQWDSTNQNLAVTWDSSQTNSYFYRSLGTILTRDDEFSVE